MKRLLALTLILILVFSISPVSQAFQDATANPYTGLIYTHDDKFDDSTLSYGVDLSVYQGSVNFSKLKNDGISFAILRAAYRGYKDSGPLAKDTKFASYASAAIDAGLDIGAYIYSQAITISLSLMLYPNINMEMITLLLTKKFYYMTLPTFATLIYIGSI